jgi:hypothetical protein
MLNPSTADAGRDDPTIRRCIALAMRDRCGGIEVMNLFAFRATRPAALKTAADPIGPGNDGHLRDLFARHTSVLAAWGLHGDFIGRAVAVMRLAADYGARLTCLGFTVRGQPRHPLYVKRDCAILPLAIQSRSISTIPL